MQKTVGLKMFAGALVGVFVLGATLSTRLQIPFTTSTSEANQTSVNTPAESQNSPDFVGLSKSLGPAVVSISTKQSVRRVRMSQHPFGEEGPFGEFRKRFFDGPLPENPSPRQGLGSGFIIDQKGLILTNNHVVEDADKIEVRLSDGREFEAEVVGRDPKTDIAVIKINADGDLPIIPLGNSDRLEVGERVWPSAIHSASNTPLRPESSAPRAETLARVRTTTLFRPTPPSIPVTRVVP